MKKIPLIILSSILTLGLSIPGDAAEPKMTVLNDEWSSVIDDFEESEYGGAYLEGDVLHIKPIDSNNITKEINAVKQKRCEGKNLNIVIDDVVEYTYKELEEAKDKVFDVADELDITSAGISNKNNAIVIGAEEWNQEKKQAVTKLAGIDNIIFETKEVKSSNFEDTRDLNLDSNYKSRASSSIYVGDQIQNGNYSSCIGACATIGNREGYVSSGHNNEIGDVFYLNGRRLGVVTEVQYGGSVDAAFIEKDSRSEYSLTDDLRLAYNLSRTGTITSSRSPVIEGAVVCFGFGSGYRIAIVEDTSYSTRVNGTRFRNLIRFDIGGNAGDSGGPVVIPKSNDKYAIVGIWKGIDKYGDGIATRWDKIEDAFDVDLY